MQNIYIYILIASLTIASPGPGVILTLSNTLHYSLKRSFFGILGISAGMGVIALIAASSIGIIIISSPIALTIVKVIGAIYLIFLGAKLFLSAPKSIINNLDVIKSIPSKWNLFREGLFVSLFNPKPIVFFMALFPQFIDLKYEYLSQLLILGFIFCFLVIVIHIVYGFFVEILRTKMKSNFLFLLLNRIGGTVFMIFAFGLIYSVLKTFF